MTQAMGTSIIHETIFEGRFSYVAELLKLGAQIEFFQPDIPDPTSFYHFKIENNGQLKKLQQAIRISGKTELHNGVLNASDIRAGATLLIAATVAKGESVVLGASIIDRGYEEINKKLQGLGASIKRV